MCTSCFGFLFRLLKGLCGDPSVKDIKDEAAQERLLPTGLQQSAPGAPPAATTGDHSNSHQQALIDAAVPLTAASNTKLIVMRHGHRQDEEDPFWHETAARPWDPPLSAKGKKQAAEVASQVSELGVHVLVSSPFRRCLQTSAELVRELGLQQGQWLVDWQLAEICDPRVLFASRHDARDAALQQQQGGIESWMWGGLALEAALDKFISEDCKLTKVPIRPVPRHTKLPRFPESLAEGLQRYRHALQQDVSQGFAGQTVLVVTHGECVRSAVMLAEPHSEVFEVKHTGFVILEQQQQKQKGKGAWRLDCEPGETGVLWLEDEDD